MEMDNTGPPAGKALLDAVLPEVYGELRRLATGLMRRERGNHTLQPTALVNETYMRLIGQHSVDYENRAQVIGVAVQMMRRILCTHEEGRKAAKRGGARTLICLEDSPEPANTLAVPFSVVDQLLERLAALDRRQALVAELRIFGGLTVQETAEFLEVSAATVARDWSSGKLWLARELQR